MAPKKNDPVGEITITPTKPQTFEDTEDDIAIAEILNMVNKNRTRKSLDDDFDDQY